MYDEVINNPKYTIVWEIIPMLNFMVDFYMLMVALNSFDKPITYLMQGQLSVAVHSH